MGFWAADEHQRVGSSRGLWRRVARLRDKRQGDDCGLAKVPHQKSIGSALSRSLPLGPPLADLWLLHNSLNSQTQRARLLDFQSLSDHFAFKERLQKHTEKIFQLPGHIFPSKNLLSKNRYSHMQPETKLAHAGNSFRGRGQHRRFEMGLVHGRTQPEMASATITTRLQPPPRHPLKNRIGNVKRVPCLYGWRPSRLSYHISCPDIGHTYTLKQCQQKVSCTLLVNVVTEGYLPCFCLRPNFRCSSCWEAFSGPISFQRSTCAQYAAALPQLVSYGSCGAAPHLFQSH